MAAYVCYLEEMRKGLGAKAESRIKPGAEHLSSGLEGQVKASLESVLDSWSGGKACTHMLPRNRRLCWCVSPFKENPTECLLTLGMARPSCIQMVISFHFDFRA